MPNVKPESAESIDANTELQRAVRFAVKAHFGQSRKSKGGIKLPYIVHPLAVMRMAYDFGINRVADVVFLIALVLHDVIEDTEYTAATIFEMFGAPVTEIVKDLSFRKRALNEVSQDYQKAKSEHLDSYATKGIKSLVAKMIDRFINVADFIAAGDLKYAKIYFHYADGLWAAFRARKQEIIEAFTAEVYEALDGQLCYYEDLFSSVVG